MRIFMKQQFLIHFLHQKPKKWRVEQRLDQLDPKEFQEELETGKTFWIPNMRDKNGFPTFLFFSGLHEVKSPRNIQKEIKYFIWQIEKVQTFIMLQFCLQISD
jgi:hypothetical protein